MTKKHIRKKWHFRAITSQFKQRCNFQHDSIHTVFAVVDKKERYKWHKKQSLYRIIRAKIYW